ncbi:MAG TPA: hypothetical protein VI298_13845 [Geobacteraceae bacterium]
MIKFPLLFALAMLCAGNIFYHQDKYSHDTPARHGLAFEDVAFARKDGTRLSGWFICRGL